jgi:uncharacterized repeat protein (TIGR03943 family)
MRRYAQLVLVFLLGATLLKLVVTGGYTRYVRPGFAVPLVLAGVALVVVAAVTLWRWIRALRLGSVRDEPVHKGVSEVEGIFGPYRLGPRDRAPYGRDPLRDPFERDPFTDSFEIKPHGPSQRAEAAGWAAAEHEGTGNVLAQRGTPAGPSTLAMAAAAGDTVVVPALPAVVADTVVVPVLPGGRPDDVEGANTAADRPVGVAAETPIATSGEPAQHLGANPDLLDEPDTLTTLDVLSLPDPDLPDPDLPDPDLVELEADGAGGGTSDGLRIGWLLLAAAIVLLLVAPPALGPFLANRGDTAKVAADGSVALPAGEDPVSISLSDYVAAAAAGGTSLAEHELRLVGFVVEGAHGEPYLARLVVGCCAASARPVWVGLTGDLPGILEQNQWVEVVGVYADQVDRDPVNGQPVPYLAVATIKYIDAPADPYET